MIRYRLLSNFLSFMPSGRVDLRVRLQVESLDERITPSGMEIPVYPPEVYVVGAPPEVSVVGPSFTYEGQPLRISAATSSGGSGWVFLSDTDQTVESTYTVQLSTTDGELAVDSSTASTYGINATSDSITVTLTGNLTQIDSFLNSVGLDYTPTAYFSGTASVTVTVTDPDNLTASAVNLVDVSPIAEMPILSVPENIDAIAGDVVSLYIFAEPVDPDGSEVISFYRLSGYPAGSTFNLGTEYSSGTGNFLLVSPLELIDNTLQMTLPSDQFGSFSISVSSATQDSAELSGFTQNDPGYTGPIEPTQSYSPESTRIINLYVSPLTLPPVAPEVSVTGPAFTYEGQDLVIFGTEGGSFISFRGESYGPTGGWVFLSDADRTEASSYSVLVSVNEGQLAVDPYVASDYGVIASNLSQSDVLFTGDLAYIESFLNQVGLLYSPTPYFSGTASLTVTVTDPDALTASAVNFIDVNPYAEPPVLAIPLSIDALAGQATQVEVSGFVGLDTDGSEVVDYYTLANYPTGTTFNIGFEYWNGESYLWEFSADDLANYGLFMTVPSYNTGYYTITVSSVAKDSAILSGFTQNYPEFEGTIEPTVAYSEPSTQSFDLCVSLPPPTLDLFDQYGQESDYIYLPTQLSDPGSETTTGYTYKLTVTHGVFYTGGYGTYYNVAETGSGTSTLTVSGDWSDIQNYLSSYLYVEPTRYFSGEASITAELNAPDGRFAMASAIIQLTPVASQLTPTVLSPVSGHVGQSVPLITSIPQLQDTDGSETESFTITGVPAGASLSAGTPLIGDSWQLTRADFVGLKVNLGSVNTTFTITVTSNVTDTANYFSTESSLEDHSTSSATIEVRVLVGPQAAPSIFGPTRLDGNEGSWTQFYYTPAPPMGSATDLTFHLSDADATTTGIYTVVIQSDVGYVYAVTRATGQPGSTVTVNGSFTPSVTLTGKLAELNAWFLGGFFVYGGDEYSGQQNVSVTVVDPDGLTAQALTRVRVLPVVDYIACFDYPPYIHAVADIPVSLQFNLPLSTDTDGSETRYAIIRGVPSYMSLSAGIYDSEFDFWRVEEADFTDLYLYPSEGFTGQVYLSIEVRAIDTASFPSFAPPDDSATSETSSYFNKTITIADVYTPSLVMPELQTILENGTTASFASFTGAGSIGIDGGEGEGASNTYVTLTLMVPSDYFGEIGILNVPSGEYPVTVSGSGTSLLTVYGRVYNVNNFLQNGFNFVPRQYYSGQVLIEAELQDEDGHRDYGALFVRVTPVVSEPVFTLNGGDLSSNVLVTTGTFTATPGFVTLNDWPDNFDSSEYSWVSFQISGVADPTAFTINTGVNGYSYGAGTWSTYGYYSVATLQSLVDSLMVVAPDGYSGLATLTVTFNINDYASYTVCEGGSDTKSPTQSVVLRFVSNTLSGSFPAVNSIEGSTTDLGGQYSISDPNSLPDDTYTLTLTVATGSLVIDYSAVPEGLSILDTGTNSVSVQGSIDEINTWLATPSGLSFIASDAYFSGSVALTVQAQNNLLSGPGTTIASGGIIIAPVASLLTPSVDSPLYTNEEVAVAVSIYVPPTPDKDGSETVWVLVTGMPAGGSFSAGSALPEGSGWRLDLADLDGLSFIPPQLFTGTIDLSVQVIVVDDSGLAQDTSYSSTASLSIVVIGEPVTKYAYGGDVAENSPLGTYAAQAVTYGGHPGETFTYSVIGTTGYDFTIGNADGTIRVGSQNPDFEAINYFELTIGLTGSRGTYETLIVYIYITDVNDAPTISTPSSFIGTEDTLLTLNGISVADQDANTVPGEYGGCDGMFPSLALFAETSEYGISAIQAPKPGIERITASVPLGTLTVDPSSTVTIDNNGTSLVVLTGTLDDLNALFAAGGLRYLGAPDFSGTVLLTLDIDDLGHTGPGGPQSTTKTVNININPVADVIALRVTNTSGLQKNPIPLTISVNVTDVDHSEKIDAIYLVGLPAGSMLNHGSLTPDGRWLVSPADLADLTLTTPDDFFGPLTITVVAVSTDSAASIAIMDHGQASATLSVLVNPLPIVTPPTVPPPPPVTVPPPPVTVPPTVMVPPPVTVPPAVTVPPPPAVLPPPVVEEQTTAADTSIVLFIANTTFAVTTVSEQRTNTTTLPVSTAVAAEQILEQTQNNNYIAFAGEGLNIDQRVNESEWQKRELENPIANYTPGQQTPTFYGFSAASGKPPPTVVPLDPTSSSAGFGGSEAENINLIDELYRDQNPTSSVIPPQSEGGLGLPSEGEQVTTNSGEDSRGGVRGVTGILVTLAAAATLSAIGVLDSPNSKTPDRRRRIPLRKHREEDAV